MGTNHDNRTDEENTHLTKESAVFYYKDANSYAFNIKNLADAFDSLCNRLDAMEQIQIDFDAISERLRKADNANKNQVHDVDKFYVDTPQSVDGKEYAIRKIERALEIFDTTPDRQANREYLIELAQHELKKALESLK